MRLTNYAVFNPRRKDFDMQADTAYEQIRWEFEYLRKADIISFWFCKERLQPIALYELGAWSMTSKPMIVGVEHGYLREFDVRTQTALARPDVEIVNTLRDLVERIKAAEAQMVMPL